MPEMRSVCVTRTSSSEFLPGLMVTSRSNTRCPSSAAPRQLPRNACGMFHTAETGVVSRERVEAYSAGAAASQSGVEFGGEFVVSLPIRAGGGEDDAVDASRGVSGEVAGGSGEVGG